MISNLNEYFYFSSLLKLPLLIYQYQHYLIFHKPESYDILSWIKWFGSKEENFIVFVDKSMWSFIQTTQSKDLYSMWR